MIELCCEYLSVWCIWLYVLVMSRTRFRVNPHYSCLNVKELLAQSRCKIWSLSDNNWTWTQNHLVHKRTLNHLAKLAKWLSYFWSTYLYGAFDWMFLSCHVCTRFRVIPHSLVVWMSRNSLYQCRCKIWRLSDCKWSWAHKHLVHKGTLTHLANLTKWLSCVMSTYLYSAFHYMLFLCNIHVSEWIDTLELPEC